MKTLNLFTLILLPAFLFAQKPIFQKVENAKLKSTPTEYSLLKSIDKNLGDLGISTDELSEGLALDLNKNQINDLQNANAELIKLTFPLPNESEITVDLMPNNVLSDDFIFRKSSDRKNATNYTPGLYYHGVISNDPNSLVAISIFDKEIIGLINTNNGNYIIGKLKGDATNQHIIYNDIDLTNSFDLDCGTEDDGVGYTQKELTMPEAGVKSTGDCIEIYIEIDDDIVTQKGGATPAINYITGLFNEVITLYANDGLTLTLSEILAWDTPSPYSGGSSSAMLSSFQANTGAFNGDLSQLVSYKASGGIAAGFAGICASNVDNSKCFSSIDDSYNIVPTYSWSVMVCTHEMGHLIGSRHTHACVWNGNNTAIDGCSGQTEGSCPLPGNPLEGGTLMSYCHLQSVGINFNNGFGSQPTAVLLNTVNNANCLTPCGGGGGPTCTDGIQNGDETGIDCGGSVCPPCPSPCTSNEISISITFDNYPEETSWEIKNAGGNVIASGGTYGHLPDGSFLLEYECLDDGCYDFTIYDSYGDGICCGYGLGSYEVTDDGGNILASGSEFTFSETTNICFGAPGISGCTNPSAHNYDPTATVDDGSCETCTDGIQNGDETGIDCGGVLCNPCPTGGEILGSYFETGWDGWSDGGSDCYRYSGSRSWEGNYSIRIRDNSGTNSAMTSPSFNLSGYSSIDIQFYFYPNSMENGEDFWLRYYDGSSWTTVAAWVSGNSFTNNSFWTTTVTLNSASYNFPPNAQIRLQCDASANADRVYIDEVTVTAFTGSLPESSKPIVNIEELGTIQEDVGVTSLSAAAQQDIMLYPNPASETVNLKSAQEIQFVKIVSLSGQLLKTIQINDYNQEIDISSFQSGIYFMLVQTEEELLTQKFVKM